MIRLQILLHLSVLLLLMLALLTPLSSWQTERSALAQTDTWTPGDDITSGSMDAVAPDIAIDSQGVSHVIYTETDFESVGTVFYQHNRTGDWSIPIPLSSDLRSEVGNGQRSATISTATVSNTVVLAVAYQGRESSGRRRIWYRESRDGGATWTTAATATPHEGIHPSLLLDDTGQPHLVYIRSDNNDLLTHYATRGADGQWESRRISKDVDRNPDITYTRDVGGRLWLHVAYQSQPGQNADQDEMQVVTMNRAPDGSWSNPEERQKNTAQFPKLASNYQSVLYLVWSARGGGFDIEPSFSFSPNQGGIWDTPQFMGTLTSDLGQRPAIARSPATGVLAVVWEDDYQSSEFVYDIYGRMSADGGVTWGELQTVFRAPGGSGTAAIDGNPTGGFRAVWDEGFFGKLRIFTSGYNDPGPSVLPPTEEPTATIPPTEEPTPEPTTPELTINHSTGAPGSYFTITGSGFPSASSGTLTINGQPLGEITIEGDGSFAFIISTLSTTPPGSYTVTVTSDGASASTSFLLNATAAVRSRDESITSAPIVLPLTVPALQPVSYLPLILQPAAQPSGTR